MNELAARVRAFAAASALWPPGSRVLAALSGGADSMALAHLLHTQGAEMGVREVGALHVHHGLRGAAADGDERLVRGACAAWGMPLWVERADVAALAASWGVGVEEAGRRVRYEALERVAAAEGYTHIATAHTRTDQLETVLLHLARGSGLRGLGGIPPARGQVVRPLLDCSRAAVEAYCGAHGLEYAEDSSNGDIAFARNRMRHRVVPELTAVNAGVEEAAARLAGQARADEAYLCGLAASALEGAASASDASASDEAAGGYDAAALMALPPPLRLRALRLAAENAGAGELAQRHLAALDGVLCGGAATLPGDIAARVRRGRLTLNKAVRTRAARTPETENRGEG